MFAELSAEKESSDDYQRLKKRRAREQAKWNFLNFYKPGNRPTSRWESPLRTGLASFPASGSSLYKPLCQEPAVK